MGFLSGKISSPAVINLTLNSPVHTALHVFFVTSLLKLFLGEAYIFIICLYNFFLSVLLYYFELHTCVAA